MMEHNGKIKAKIDNYHDKYWKKRGVKKDRKSASQRINLDICEMEPTEDSEAVSVDSNGQKILRRREAKKSELAMANNLGIVNEEDEDDIVETIPVSRE